MSEIDDMLTNPKVASQYKVNGELTIRDNNVIRMSCDVG